ncbi:mothers against decapentaplegic homolog 7 isoform X2 [Gracilinanus agilis]|uniref:mothers against decapentaplegic homolog 7 isoform X2 n=1 Tax=Gracilinanus agilis TaxID=191870 RepID=UPI001CFCE1FF|nr:mothers against decapentaplegic homolog 7 isoform X2 [Gracilinanus agilis]
MFRTKRSVLVRRLWRSRAPGGEDEEEGAGGGGGGGGGGGEPRGEGATDSRAHGAGGGGGAGRGGCCLGKSVKGAKGHHHHHHHHPSLSSGAAGGSEAELKALTHSVLKKLKERQLELLLQAVESRGGTRTACLLLPGRVDSRLALGQGPPASPLQTQPTQPQPPPPPLSYSLPLLLCKVFRWPDLRHSSEVKRLCCCESYGKNNPELVCCNPHHLSRLCELESPPPPYSRYPMDFLKPTECPDAVPSSTETGGTNYLAPGGLSDSQLLQEPGDQSHWCVVAYWEEKTRVGRLYSVQEPSLDIFYDLPQGNGFCLGQLNSDNKSQLVQKVRSKIGCGIQLTREVDGVWVYNRSSYPIFIKSATLDNPDSRTLLVHKVFPGFSIKAFDYEKAYSLQRPNDHEFMQQPWTGFTVQISFVKGWGQCYTRQFISSCPCWLEVIFNNR